MALSEELVSLFAKTVNAQNNKKDTNTSSVVYGKIVEYNGHKYVQIDGSDQLTPVETATSLNNGDRVTVKIEDHTALVTGNISDPSASSKSVTEIGDQISEFEIIMADKVSTKVLEAESARIDSLEAENVTIKGDLKATNAEIETLQAEDVKITGKLNAVEAEIKKLDAEKVSTEFLEANYAEIEDLEATNADIHNLEADFGNFQQTTVQNFEATNANIAKLETEKASVEYLEANYAEIEDLEATNADIQNLTSDYGDFKTLTTDNLTAIQANIQNLDAEKLNAESADIKYANIDFANITEAAVKKIFADYGIIDEVVISEGTVVKELIGVLIKGDLIEANTLKADSLIVKGTDGLYYKLNVEAGVTTSEQVSKEDLQNGIHGSVIIAKSIAAEKIAVDDLVAFGATIAGFNIKKENGIGKLYSLVKESITNTTAGVYMDSSGQLSVGDANNYLMFYKSTDGTYKLAICADSVLFGAGKKNIESVMKDIEDVANTAQNTANNAQSAATEAKTAANEAKSTAGTAQSTANDAKTTAGAAQTTANDAKTAATNAQSTANAATSAANAAQSTASNAQNAAVEAKTAADGAQTTANDAKTAATNAQSTADEVSTSLDQSVGDLTDSITATGVESATKLGQLRELLSQVVTDKNGHSLMIETPESYVRTSETITAVSGVPVSGVTTTTGEQVYVFDGEYYTVVDSVYYKVTYTPATCTFNISDLEAAIESANSSLSSLSGQMDSIDSTVNMIQKTVDDLGIIGGYIYIDQEFDVGDGDTVPAIVLGESDSEFKVVITNEYIAFMEGSAVPAYISGQTLIAQNIEVQQQLVQGGFAWTIQGGNIGLLWTGPTTASVTVTNSTGYTPATGSNIPTTASIGRPCSINVMLKGPTSQSIFGRLYMDGVLQKTMHMQPLSSGVTSGMVFGVPIVSGNIILDLALN